VGGGRLRGRDATISGMQDHELYRRILGIEAPWYVDSVELKLEVGEIHVRLAHHDIIDWPCPECGTACKLYDHQPERQWRHLDTCQYQTILHAEPPRSECSNHGVRVVKMAWAEPASRFTALFELLAIEWLKAASQKAVAGLLKLSWDEIHGIMERAVKRGLERRKAELVSQIGVDEKAFRKGHSYLTLVNDLIRGRVLYVAEDRKQSSLDGFWETLTGEQISGIGAVAMDMWDPYIASTRSHVPNGERKIVFDRFHIMKHMNEAVDAVRKQENRLLMEDDIDVLKGTKFLWLFAEENVPEKMVERFAFVRELNLKTSRAWAIKEALRELWRYRRKGWAELYWKQWYFWATHCRLKPVTKVARMIHNHLDNVLTYFDHRITNAVSEGLNSKIQTVKKTPMGIAIGSI
jgi:transposase